jgi:hypothetical protein
MSSEGDVVLIHINEKPAFYARIEAIEPDVKRDWYRITLLMLSIPQQVITWILRAEYINGTPFTMDGNPVMIQEIKKVSLSEDVKSVEPPPGKETGVATKGKVLTFKPNPK